VSIKWKGISPFPYEYALPIRLSKIIIEVKDEGWSPISGAKVLFIFREGWFSAITDKLGVAEVKIPTTNYTLKVSKEGYFPHEESLNISVPSAIMRVIQLYRSIKLTLEIRDEAGAPINNATVAFSSKDVGNFTKTTNASGMAEFEIPRTDYTLTVSKKGYLSYKEFLDLSKSPIETKTIQLKPELTWWEQYWPYIIAGVIAVCIIVPIVLKLKRKSL